MKQVVLSKSFGNNSNRMIQSAHFEAYCLERGYSYFNQQDIAGNFHRAFDVTEHSSFEGRIPSRYVPEVLGGNIDFKNGKACISRLDRHIDRWAKAFVSGWGFRAGSLVEKFREPIRQRQKVNESRLPLEAREFYSKIKLNEFVCGFHIRRKDYRTWQGGKYFFSNSEWCSIIDRVQDFIKVRFGANTQILLFSDEPSSLDGVFGHVVETGSWSIDQFLMGSCDYVLGPPSTFSMWASFNWGARLHHLSTASQEIDLRHAEVCKRLE